MFIDYTQAILEHYHRKRNENSLSPRLARPTPARLKQECMIVREKGYQKKDERALADFFGEASDQTACLRAIKKTNPDTFKPLVKYLRKETTSTEDKNVELLAWLIDFDRRPHKFGETYEVGANGKGGMSNDAGENEESEENREGAEGHEVEENEKGKEEQGKKEVIGSRRMRKATIILLSLTVIACWVYWLWSRKPMPPRIDGQGCMYWADDHYQPVNCNKKMENVQVIALDTAMLYHLKKITEPDTITVNAVGHVWYVKYRGNYEYYTADGFHPMDPNLRLRPITVYIIRNHLASTP